MLMNSKTIAIHSEMIYHAGFNESNKNSIYLNVIQVTALLEYCTSNTAI